MKKFSKILLSPVTTIVLFAVAAALILTGTIGGARAAIMQETRVYQSQVQMQDIGVTLQENPNLKSPKWEDISWRNYVVDENGRANGTWNENTGELLKYMLAEGEMLQGGKWYDEELRIANTGTIDQYSRVTLYKYWVKTDENGKQVKDTSMDPALIDLHLVNLDSDWLLDESATTDERVVLYFNRILPSSVSSPSFMDQIRINTDNIVLNPTATTVETKTGDNGRTKTVKTITFEYDGSTFVLQAEVDAVQTHNAEDAIRSAWGRIVSIQNGTLSLVQ